MESNNYLLMNISILYRCGQKYYDKQLIMISMPDSFLF